MISFKWFAILVARALVIIFESQLERVIGLQFLISFKFFPSFGNKESANSNCDGGKIPVSTLKIHDYIIELLRIDQNFL